MPKQRSVATTIEIKRASIPQRVQTQVWARAAGRCVLCAKYLIDERWNRTHFHSATLVGELAHNVGATTGDGSPRGGTSSLTEGERSDSENLLLLCHDCHRSIDGASTRALFTVEWLTARKHEHELRVRRATNFSTLHRTLVITTRSRVRGTDVVVSQREVSAALIEAGLVLHVEDGTPGDVTIVLDADLNGSQGWEHERLRIDRGLRKLATAVDDSTQPVDHLSVFALAPIPLLVYLGTLLDDKMALQIFDRHRDRGQDEAWCWGPNPTTVPSFVVAAGQSLQPDARDVVAVLNVSGTLRDSNLPAGLHDHPRIELAPEAMTPRPGIIDSATALNAAAAAWRDLLGLVEAACPNTERLHVLGAIPASLAVRIGTHIMRTAHWDTIVYQLTDDGYLPTPAITNHQDRE